MNPSPIRLLLVEDNEDDALLLRHALAEEDAGAFHVAHVETMVEAIRRLGRDSFDAILLDLWLPDSRGLETVERACAAAPGLPILVTTGLADEATAVEAVRKGAQDYLVKGQSDGRALARSIRYAMQRKQAELELKALNETLERRVAERTAMATRRAAQLQRLALELTRIQHRERRRLARILHDHLQQLLYAARLHLETLRRGGETGPAPAETIDRIDGLLSQCIDESRSLSVELFPPVLYEAGLAAALEWLGRHMDQTCGLKVEVQADPRTEPESEELRFVLFEAARELLFNVVKHAGTGRARVAMTACGDEEVRLVVSDEGVGFAPAELKLEEAAIAGFGLFSIRERLEMLGGRVEVEAALGRGTRVALSVRRRAPDPRNEKHSPPRAGRRGSRPKPANLPGA